MSVLSQWWSGADNGSTCLVFIDLLYLEGTHGVILQCMYCGSCNSVADVDVFYEHFILYMSCLKIVSVCCVVVVAVVEDYISQYLW